MKSITLAVLVLLVGAITFGQTATPNTTLCAAATAKAASVCLTSVTGVVDQTGLYIDNEYMVVTLSQNQTISAGGYVPVRRGERGGKGAPTAHANGAVVWEALTPTQTVVSGVNGFMFGTNFQEVGTCSRTSEIYLPHIWPDLGIKRDCTTVGYWVDSPSSELAVGPQNPFQAITGATATVPAVSGNYLLTYSSGTTAVTLTAPTAGVSDGAMVTFYSTSAEAHTITCTSHIMTGSSQTGVLTFAAHPGAGVTLVAYNGYWIIVANNLVTLTS